jgi:hypothetical protein
MSRSSQEGRNKPYLQGQLAIQAPYFYDILGALTVEQVSNSDPLQPPYKVRRMYVERTNEYEAGERVQGRLGSIVEQDKLSIEVMLNTIFGPKQTAVTETTKQEEEVKA